jgi:hypothetical protein
MQDEYRIIIFEGSECINGDTPLKSHLTLADVLDRPDDRFLRLHFQRCLIVSACGGDATDDYEEQDIDLFTEELGVFDIDMDITDP